MYRHMKTNRPPLPSAHLHVPAVQCAITTRSGAVRGALECSNVKGSGVGLTPALVIISYDVLTYVVLLQR